MKEREEDLGHGVQGADVRVECCVEILSDCGWRGGFREEGNACVIYQDIVSLSEDIVLCDEGELPSRRPNFSRTQPCAASTVESLVTSSSTTSRVAFTPSFRSSWTACWPDEMLRQPMMYVPSG